MIPVIERHMVEGTVGRAALLSVPKIEANFAIREKVSLRKLCYFSLLYGCMFELTILTFALARMMKVWASPKLL